MMFLNVISIIAACLTTAVGQTAPPNIVFVITDDQGYGDLGYAHAPQKSQQGKKAKPVLQNPPKSVHRGHWAVKVVAPGNYRIGLRRWPLEADAPITASLPPGADVPGANKAYRARPGTAIPVATAIMRLNGEDIETKSVQPDDREVSFTVQLIAGSHLLAPTFVDASGNEIGAYYTLITKLP